jgi:hypothetical protein
MGSEWYYMIYSYHWFYGHNFFERWNYSQSAIIRLEELMK